ncbi:hypothetical protein SIN8267_02168 [Sinobacterium norvegicum]|uniref:DKNYY family protein n=1 Tax=Sinobacterium norvegicum TaxID=1641715 RepID=A0ABM9AFR4_9GAMM|nr:DKNYY domain-containing protein [Sinobacterium norvegicum]CAH0992053.1 hypothetical protein SIN8267_02168 [Sinobacterium norvegicum]
MAKLGHGYERVHGEIRYSGRVIMKADSASFEVFNKQWAKDKYRAYRHGDPVRGVDIDSFVILNEIFSKDISRVYFNIGNLKDVDAKTFTVLDVGKNFAGRVSVDNYLLIDETEYCGYAKDKEMVFFHTSSYGKPKKIKSANVNTFQSIDYGYGKDDKRCFYKGVIVKGADPDTLEVIGQYHAKDGKSVFYRGEKIVDANPEHFEMLDHPFVGNCRWAKDDRHIYCQERIHAVVVAK